MPPVARFRDFVTFTFFHVQTFFFLLSFRLSFFLFVQRPVPPPWEEAQLSLFRSSERSQAHSEEGTAKPAVDCPTNAYQILPFTRSPRCIMYKSPLENGASSIKRERGEAMRWGYSSCGNWLAPRRNRETRSSYSGTWRKK